AALSQLDAAGGGHSTRRAPARARSRPHDAGHDHPRRTPPAVRILRRRRVPGRRPEFLVLRLPVPRRGNSSHLSRLRSRRVPAGLLLVGGSLLAIVKIVTAFTVAHSV